MPYFGVECIITPIYMQMHLSTHTITHAHARVSMRVGTYRHAPRFYTCCNSKATRKSHLYRSVHMSVSLEARHLYIHTLYHMLTNGCVPTHTTRSYTPTYEWATTPTHRGYTVRICNCLFIRVGTCTHARFSCTHKRQCTKVRVDHCTHTTRR